ncbi:MAG: 1-acyl-sn-glycerol-3-phosphate acyltransferase [Pseudomonadota bacterium]
MAYHPDSLEDRDPALIARALPLLEAFNARYFRLQCQGSEHVPRGPVMFVGNHNGGIIGPDLPCTLAHLWRLLDPASPLFALAHDFAMHQFTPLGRLLQRFGALSAKRANASRVLAAGGQVLVYPGGDLEAYRRFTRRNEVVLLPRTGFVRVARELGAPIVPIVAHGAHRSAFIFSEGKRLAAALRMQSWARLQRFPLALALPWGLAAGPWLPYFPLPFRVQLRILSPIFVNQADDATEVARHVQDTMQQSLREMSA